MCQISWCGFTWEVFGNVSGAIATLVTGGLAFWAARRIGLKQLEITDRQAEISANQNGILERQSALQELGVRVSVFEIRYETYAAVVDYLEDSKGKNGGDPRPVRGSDTISVHLDRARFLFGPQHRQKAIEAIYVANKLLGLRDKAANNEPPNYEKLEATFNDLNGRLSDLIEDWGRIMGLYDLSAPVKMSDQ